MGNPFPLSVFQQHMGLSVLKLKPFNKADIKDDECATATGTNIVLFTVESSNKFLLFT